MSQCALVVSQALSCADTALSSPLLVTIQKLYRDLTPAARHVASVSQSCCVVLQGAATPYHSLAATYRNTKRSPLATIQNLYRDSPHGQATPARASFASTRRPAVSWPLLDMSWGCVTGLLALSWPPTARPCALCHDTTYCIVTQTGKWAVAHSVS